MAELEAVMRNYLQTSKFKKGQPKYTMMNKLGSLNSVSALSVVCLYVVLPFGAFM